MSDITIGFGFLGILLFLILLRFPIGAALIGVSFCGLWSLVGWRIAWASLGTIPYQFASNWVLSSVPTFLFMGFVCYHSRLTHGLFEAGRVWLGRLPAGLAIASILGCSGFAAVTGSSVACSAAMGKIAVPEMVRHGYNPGLAAGTVAAGGTIGALIPPSILMILYGVVAQVPISKLFVGGAVVGVVTVLAYVLVILIRVRLNRELAPGRGEAVPLRRKMEALLDVWPVLLIVVAIFGGLFSGVFTPTEAGAVGAFLSCLVAALKGRLSWSVLRSAGVETLQTTAALLIIAIGASLLTRFLALSGSGDAISGAVLNFGAEPLVVIVMIIAIYLLLGMFLEPIGAMLLTLPVVLPIVGENGFALIWFGILLTKLLEIGMLTPPIGMNVFVIKGVIGDLASTGTIFRAVFWFLVADLFIVALMIGFPGLIAF